MYDPNEEIKALVSVSDEEMLKLKKEKLKSIILAACRPLIDACIGDIDEEDAEEGIIFPLVAWGRYSKYENKGSDLYFSETFSTMSSRFSLNEPEMEKLLEKMDEIVIQEKGVVWRNYHFLDIPRELLVELYGGDDAGTECLVVQWMKYEEDDEMVEEYFVTTIECEDWE